MSAFHVDNAAYMGYTLLGVLVLDKIICFQDRRTVFPFFFLNLRNSM